MDLNPYLRPELILSALRHASENAGTLQAQFGALLDRDRWTRLLDYHRAGRFETAAFLREFGIEYTAPGDAARSGLAAQSIDFHTSNTTLEHIPQDILVAILREGDRILREDGLFIHRVDYSDHFAHSDRSISLVNFLQYSDGEWNRYANHRYMYMNRLRHDDLLKLFQTDGRRILGDEPDLSPQVLEALRDGRLQVAPRFAAKPLETLATTGAWPGYERQ